MRPSLPKGTKDDDLKGTSIMPPDDEYIRAKLVQVTYAFDVFFMRKMQIHPEELEPILRTIHKLLVYIESRLLARGDPFEKIEDLIRDCVEVLDQSQKFAFLEAIRAVGITESDLKTLLLEFIKKEFQRQFVMEDLIQVYLDFKEIYNLYSIDDINTRFKIYDDLSTPIFKFLFHCKIDGGDRDANLDNTLKAAILEMIDTYPLPRGTPSEFIADLNKILNHPTVPLFDFVGQKIAVVKYGTAAHYKMHLCMNVFHEGKDKEIAVLKKDQCGDALEAALVLRELEGEDFVKMGSVGGCPYILFDPNYIASITSTGEITRAHVDRVRYIFSKLASKGYRAPRSGKMWLSSVIDLLELKKNSSPVDQRNEMKSLDTMIREKEKEVLKNAGRAVLGTYYTEEFLDLINHNIEELYGFFNEKAARDGDYPYSKATRGYLAMKIARFSSLRADDENLVEYYLGHHEFEGLMMLVEALETFKLNLIGHVVSLQHLDIDQKTRLFSAFLEGGKSLMEERLGEVLAKKRRKIPRLH